MDKLIYIRDTEATLKETGYVVTEPSKFEFEFHGDLTMEELTIIFKRLALALGYAEQTVNDYLGEV